MMRAAPARRMAGLGLVELMVAVVIGMMAIIVVLQVFALSEGSRRTISGGDDALNSGAIALATLQRDVRQAGYGISTPARDNEPTLLGCGLALPGGWTLASLGPVTINPAGVPAGDTGTDTLLVVYGNGAGSPDGDPVVAQSATGTYTVSTPTAFAVGDRLIAQTQSRPTPCTLAMETALTVTSPSPPQVTVATGVAGMTNGLLFNLGPAPRLQAYAVRSGNLTVCDYLANNCGDASLAADPTVWVPTGGSIVSLRAEYGVDTTPAPMDGIVDVYNRTTPATACEWTRVSSLRLALVARSGQYEKTEVTAAAPARAASGATAIDLTSLPDWQHYRYKLFETTVPLRNIAWQGAPAGC